MYLLPKKIVRIIKFKWNMPDTKVTSFRGEKYSFSAAAPFYLFIVLAACLNAGSRDATRKIFHVSRHKLENKIWEFKIAYLPQQ